jgi:toxin-antitoxin system PIN domain toxin
VKIVDANVLLYAVNVDAPRHQQARRWLDESLSLGASVGFAWIALLAFVRLSTKSGIFPTPLSTDAALERVDSWLGARSARIVEPTARHPSLLVELLAAVGTGGNIVNDAHLAALSIEHRGAVVSYDSDFGRFPGVRWEVPAV